MINWEATKEEHVLQSKIGTRASALAKEVGVEYKQITAVMDIGACHSNGNPLRLADLLEADEENFAHDVFGIMANIDRATGKLANCFAPRYSAAEYQGTRYRIQRLKSLEVSYPKAEIAAFEMALMRC